MASWIGASPSQRFWQYTVPAARKAVADGGWLEAQLAEYQSLAAAAKAALDVAEPGSLEARRWTRRLEGYRRDYASLQRQRKRDLEVLAEADRRKALHRK